MARQNPDVKVSNLKILQFNVFWRPNIIRFGKNEYARERAAILLERVKPYDVVCLNECFSFVGSPVSSFVKAMQAQGFRYFARSPSAALFSLEVLDSGIIVFSKYPILATTFIAFDLSIEIDQFIGKGALYSQIQTGPGTHVHVWAVHPQANYKKCLPGCKSMRLAQLRQMMATLRRRSCDGQPIIIIGDLNVNALERAVTEKRIANDYQRLLETVAIESYSVTDTMLESYHEHVPTFGEDDRSLTAPDDIGSKQRLDYILVLSREDGEYIATGTNSEVLKFEVDKCPFTHLSDHYGIDADIIFSRRTGGEV
jgi:endonuclease/exonuclease/phosphatase family metal-dependent hydrolase